MDLFALITTIGIILFGLILYFVILSMRLESLNRELINISAFGSKRAYEEKLKEYKKQIEYYGFILNLICILFIIITPLLGYIIYQRDSTSFYGFFSAFSGGILFVSCLTIYNTSRNIKNIQKHYKDESDKKLISKNKKHQIFGFIFGIPSLLFMLFCFLQILLQ